MDIGKKIEEIREKPDQVRMQYVVLCVGISMVILFIFWIFSVKSALTHSSENSPASTCANDTGTCQTTPDKTLRESLSPVDNLGTLDAPARDTEEKSVQDLIVPE